MAKVISTNMMPHLSQQYSRKTLRCQSPYELRMLWRTKGASTLRVHGFSSRACFGFASSNHVRATSLRLTPSLCTSYVITFVLPRDKVITLLWAFNLFGTSLIEEGMCHLFFVQCCAVCYDGATCFHSPAWSYFRILKFAWCVCVAWKSHQPWGKKLRILSTYLSRSAFLFVRMTAARQPYISRSTSENVIAKVRLIANMMSNLNPQSVWMWGEMA